MFRISLAPPHNEKFSGNCTLNRTSPCFIFMAQSFRHDRKIGSIWFRIRYWTSIKELFPWCKLHVNNALPLPWSKWRVRLNPSSNFVLFSPCRWPLTCKSDYQAKVCYYWKTLRCLGNLWLNGRDLLLIDRAKTERWEATTLPSIGSALALIYLGIDIWYG